MTAPGTPPPPPPPPPDRGPAAGSSGSPGGVDEVAAAKARLLELGEEAGDEKFEPGFVKEHPYLTGGAALLAGVVCGRVPMLRKATLAVAMWAGKRSLARHLEQMFKGK